MIRRKVLGGSLLGKANPAEDGAKRLTETRWFFCFYLFKSEKILLHSGSSQPGKSGKLQVR